MRAWLSSQRKWIGTWISRFLVLQIFPNQIYVNINGILVLQNSILTLLLKIAYNREDEIKLLTAKVSMSHLLLLGKFEYTGGPIFKVVLEC